MAYICIKNIINQLVLGIYRKQLNNSRIRNFSHIAMFYRRLYIYCNALKVANIDI